MPHKSRAIIVLVGLFLAGCASNSIDRASERERLLRRDAEWATAAAEGEDVDRIVSYWSEDAIVIPPGQPVIEGKEAIRRYVASALQIPEFRIHWTAEDAQLSPDGKLAWMRGRNEVTIPGPDGQPMTLHGRTVTVWRREPDGEWRCILDIWNDASPPAPSAATSPAIDQ